MGLRIKCWKLLVDRVLNLWFFINWDLTIRLSLVMHFRLFETKQHEYEYEIHNLDFFLFLIFLATKQERWNRNHPDFLNPFFCYPHGIIWFFVSHFCLEFHGIVFIYLYLSDSDLSEKKQIQKETKNPGTLTLYLNLWRVHFFFFYNPMGSHIFFQCSFIESFSICLWIFQKFHRWI